MRGAPSMSKDELDVSRETIELLQQYVDLLKKWNPKINLVSRQSLNEVWTRHIKDSLQVAKSSSAPGLWVDLGSGGGFPGVVVAICRKSQQNAEKVVLVESDQKKCAFLRTVIRSLQLNAEVRVGRIEEQPPLKAKTLSARALSDVCALLGFAELHLLTSGVAVFPKGQSWEKEVKGAQSAWSFSMEVVQSDTDGQAAILKLTNIQRKASNDEQSH